MPEGDTIHRAARRLAAALDGREVVAFEAPRTPRPWPGPGERVQSVQARGKHLLVGFSGGLSLRTHLRMSGSWHLYRPGERWRKPRHLARAVVTVAGPDGGEPDGGEPAGAARPGWVAVCFSAPEVELVRAGGAAHPGLDHLGPDLAGEAPDLDACLAAMASIPAADTSIADVLRDQRVACGVGNVYVSEVLHLEGVHPARPLGEVDEADRRRLLATAHRLLRANLTTPTRTTVPGGLAVYGRAGRACRRCGRPVQVGHGGQHARVTYWCERCQPSRAPVR